eukprot:1235665-Amphidinium_carterae.1
MCSVLANKSTSEDRCNFIQNRWTNGWPNGWQNGLPKNVSKVPFTFAISFCEISALSGVLTHRIDSMKHSVNLLVWYSRQWWLTFIKNAARVAAKMGGKMENQWSRALLHDLGWVQPLTASGFGRPQPPQPITRKVLGDTLCQPRDAESTSAMLRSTVTAHCLSPRECAMS